MTDDVINRLKQYSFKLLSIRPRSIDELRFRLSNYCHKHEYSDKYIDKTLSILKNYGFLDDLKFALWWLEQRDLTKPKGKYVLVYELREKGISDEIINKVMSERNSQKSLQKDLAIKILQKKKYLFDKLPNINKKLKIKDLLIRRGFEIDIISQVIDYYLKKE
jgi:regulatory protein